MHASDAKPAVIYFKMDASNLWWFPSAFMWWWKPQHFNMGKTTFIILGCIANIKHLLKNGEQPQNKNSEIKNKNLTYTYMAPTYPLTFASAFSRDVGLGKWSPAVWSIVRWWWLMNHILTVYIPRIGIQEGPDGPRHCTLITLYTNAHAHAKTVEGGKNTGLKTANEKP